MIENLFKKLFPKNKLHMENYEHWQLLVKNIFLIKKNWNHLSFSEWFGNNSLSAFPLLNSSNEVSIQIFRTDFFFFKSMLVIPLSILLDFVQASSHELLIKITYEKNALVHMEHLVLYREKNPRIANLFLCQVHVLSI